MNLDFLKLRLSRLGKNSTAKNTLWMILAQGGRLFLQAGYFIILARSLGPEQYGAFVGVTSLVGIFDPFAAWGAGNILVKNVVRDRSLFSEYLGNAIFLTFTSGIILVVLTQIIAALTLPKSISPWLVLLVSLSDILFATILEIASRSFQAVKQLSRTAQFYVLISANRLVAAFLLIHLFKAPTNLQWGFLYFLSTAISALISIGFVLREIGAPKLALWRVKHEITEGFYFSIGASSQTIYNNIDKTMLASLSTLEATGIYAAAYRLLDVAFVPMRSLVVATYPNFFKHGERGIKGSIEFAKRLLPSVFVFGLVATICLFLVAPIVPYILGDEYASSIGALQGLAPIILLRSMHVLAANVLTGADLQGFRSITQVLVAIVNVALNFWILPLYSWQGAVFTSLASDGLLLIILVGIVWLKSKPASN